VHTLLQIGLSNAAVATGLAVLAAGAGRVVRRPALVHALWLLVFLKLVTPPVWMFAVPWPDASQQAGSVAAIVSSSQDEPLPAASFRQDPAAAVETPADEPIASPLRAISWEPIVLAAWAIGSALWWLVAGVRVLQFRKLLRHAQPATLDVQEQASKLATRLGLARCPGVWFLPAPVSPMLWTLTGAPRLLLPWTLWQRLAPEQQDTLLAHELAHLRRRDHWVRLLELLVLGLYWWLPVVWWARRALREAEEQCCDAWVIWALPSAVPAYASALVETVAFLSRTYPGLPATASGIGHTLLLRRRLTMIMRGTTPRALSAFGLFIVLGLAAAVLPLLPTWAQTEPRLDQPPAAVAQPVPPEATDPHADFITGLYPAYVESRLRLDEPEDAQTRVPVPEVPRPATTPQLAEEIQKARDEIELLAVQRQIKQAQLRGAQAGTVRLRNKIQRAQQLAKNGGVSATEVDDAKAELEAQEAAIQVKEAELKEADVRLRQAARRLTALEQRKGPIPAKDKPRPTAQPPQPDTTEAAKLRSELGSERARLEVARIEEDVARTKVKELGKHLADADGPEEDLQKDLLALEKWKKKLFEATRERVAAEERVNTLEQGLGRLGRSHSGSVH
jgi:bla regulator protein BlaR1